MDPRQAACITTPVHPHAVCRFPVWDRPAESHGTKHWGIPSQQSYIVQTPQHGGDQVTNNNMPSDASCVAVAAAALVSTINY